jgi:hypothetical protein
MKTPKIIGVQRELEPLYRSGVKYVAYEMLDVDRFDQTPTYAAMMDDKILFPLRLAAESIEELKTCVRSVEPVAEWRYLYRINDCIEREHVIDLSAGESSIDVLSRAMASGANSATIYKLADDVLQHVQFRLVNAHVSPEAFHPAFDTVSQARQHLMEVR